MNEIRVKPVYGFGWREGETSIDVPKAFSVRIHKSERGDGHNQYTLLIGRISGFFHRYSGRWAVLTIRTVEKPATYNVRIYKELKSISTEELRSESAIATGFAELG